MTTYATSMLRELIGNGPSPGDDFYRMKATGNGETFWFNVSPTQLSEIATMLDKETTS